MALEPSVSGGLGNGTPESLSPSSLALVLLAKTDGCLLMRQLTLAVRVVKACGLLF